MKILLTGSTGFLGRNLQKKFDNEGLVTYNVVRERGDARSTAYPANSITLSEVDGFLEENKIDFVIHAATEYGRDNLILPVLEANLTLPLTLLEKTNLAKIPFINIDSYFNKSECKYYSLPHYSLSKKSLLMWLEYYSESRTIFNLRLEHLYGPADSKQKFIPTALESIAVEKQPEFAISLGNQIRDFIHVEDACTAIYSVVTSQIPEGSGLKSFEVGTGIGTSIIDLLNEIKLLSNSETEIVVGAIPTRIGEIAMSVADKKFNEYFKWEPTINLKAGLLSMMRNSNAKT